MNLKTVCFGLTALLFSTSPVFATTYHNGGDHDFPTSGTPVTSMYADITTPNYPYVYSPGFSTTYVMIMSSDYSQWAQVGWTKEQGMGGTSKDGVHYFYEYHTGGISYQTFTTNGPSANTIHGYRMRVENGNYVGYADNTIIDTWPSAFNGYSIEISEEIDGAQNGRFAGRSDGKSKFANIRAFYNNTTYYSPNLVWTNDSSNGRVDKSKYVVGNASSTIDLWDYRTN